MNSGNLRFLVVGFAIGIFTIKSTELTWSVEKATMRQITSVDSRATAKVALVDVDVETMEDRAAKEEPVNIINMQEQEEENDDEKKGAESIPSVSEGPAATLQATSISKNITVKARAIPAAPDASVPKATQGTITIPAATATQRASSTNGTLSSYDMTARNDGGVQDFVKQPNVVIAMKIHGDAFVPEVKQCMCLLHAAYNNRVLYDIIIFVTIALPEQDMQDIRAIVHPANINFVVDEKTFEDQIAELTPAQKKTLLNRCPGVNKTEDLSWHERCRDGKHWMPLAYCWMSEFRSKQIWTQKALAKYKYMLWFDSDSFSTMVWKQDPVAFAIRKNLVLLMGNYPQGSVKAMTGVHYRISQAYNRTLCSSELDMFGRLRVTYGDPETCRTNVQGTHGYFHITDLDFYRLPQNLHWSEVLIGDGKFQRIWDDQLAVIVPPAMLAPERTMEMETAGLKLEVMHNGMMMGKRKWVGGAFKKFFRRDAPTKFPEAMHCKPFIKIPSRS